MGSGASALLPETEADALAHGYTQEQINTYRVRAVWVCSLLLLFVAWCLRDTTFCVLSTGSEAGKSLSLSCKCVFFYAIAGAS